MPVKVSLGMISGLLQLEKYKIKDVSYPCSDRCIYNFVVYIKYLFYICGIWA